MRWPETAAPLYDEEALWADLVDASRPPTVGESSIAGDGAEARDDSNKARPFPFLGCGAVGDFFPAARFELLCVSDFSPSSLMGVKYDLKARMMAKKTPGRG